LALSQALVNDDPRNIPI